MPTRRHSDRRSSGASPPHSQAAILRGAAALALFSLLVAGCTQVALQWPIRMGPGQAVYRRAESTRADVLARDVERLRADLQQAEQTLLDTESGMRGTHTRADAVSAVAEARIELARVAERATWRRAEAAEARAKLEEADKQVRAGRFGSAIFFASRAERIAQNLAAEIRAVDENPGIRLIASERVNLRTGSSTEHEVLAVLARDTPVFVEARRVGWALVRTVSGEVGWIHVSLLRERR